jgi:hypothetical protein
MTSSEFIEFTNEVYEKALEGKRLMLTGDSFFIAVAEKQLITKLANADVRDISLATYKPALNAHFFSGGQIVIVDFFAGSRGLHQLQFIDNLDEIMVLESSEGSAKRLVDEHIVPITVMFDKVQFVTMEP